MTDIYGILQDTFGKTAFRTHQEEIIQDILGPSKRDLLVLMPTGGGKSLCYQLSAVASPGWTLVISPLIALIWDQIDDLKKHGLEAAYWRSDLTNDERAKIHEGLSTGQMKILYTTPEMMATSLQLTALVKKAYDSETGPTGPAGPAGPAGSTGVTGVPTGGLDRIVIDEAHCVSNWGHEFRESYLELTRLKRHYPGIQLVAFTATATPEVQMDIIRILGLCNSVRVYRQSYVRENLHYLVRSRDRVNMFTTIHRWIRDNDYLRRTGIIYCLSRSDCENTCVELRKKGLSVEYFHAQIPTAQKKQIQQRWIEGKTKIIVATIAFALGINKSNVRFVIHCALPKSIEGYYQETGRAGRDGRTSRCLLLYSRQDKHILQSMARKTVTGTGTGPSLLNPVKRVEDMYTYASDRLDCRVQSLCRYLGENLSYQCGNCDNCTGTNSYGKEKSIIKYVESLRSFFTRHMASHPETLPTKADLLRELSVCAVNLSTADRQRLIYELIVRNYLDIQTGLDSDNNITSQCHWNYGKALDPSLMMLLPDNSVTDYFEIAIRPQTGASV